ncbi:peptidoglycan editing factor PgeF [Thiohalobacter sp. IOR34]|uniref:peptidoglycan editing factor PgeF n=1 Tax=Thiohalobacter sp. IOR34 TaxID=3057176 RepID=UPI0025B09FB8|nr:peptidoglycan editing factor PgeF [Thiohalobacter sp. IOR34]WJW74922.1 peptidoglycan editing factor PgeF [Thiohalobacter sp. IOR34]
MREDETADWLIPDWPAPAVVRALTTTRAGGVSRPPYDSLNLADHVGDDPAAVAANRERLRTRLGLPAEPVWLRQVHGTGIVDAARLSGTAGADGSTTAQPGVVCAVLTADCLPLLLCDRAGRRVAAVHAGWRGLAGGVIEAALDAMDRPGSELLAWLGPAIGPRAFAVGDEVRAAFVAADPAAATAFHREAGGWRADLYALARQRLAARGVRAVYGGHWCTHEDRARFYSYRRDGDTGRMASLIWLEPGPGGG